MRKMYSSAPLPFVGQKRMFAKEFIKVLGQFPDSTVFVDLFGGQLPLPACEYSGHQCAVIRFAPDS